MVRPVSVRQPSERWLRYWMCRRPRRTVWTRCSRALKATFDSHRVVLDRLPDMDMDLAVLEGLLTRRPSPWLSGLTELPVLSRALGNSAGWSPRLDRRLGRPLRRSRSCRALHPRTRSVEM